MLLLVLLSLGIWTVRRIADGRAHAQPVLIVVGLGLLGALTVALGAGPFDVQTLGAVTAGYLDAVLGAALGGGLGLVVVLFVPARTSRAAPGQAASTLAPVLARFAKHRVAVLAAVILGLLIETALLAGVIEWVLGVSHEVTALDLRYLPPSGTHLLGTDDLGRDLFTRLIFGGQISLSVGLISALSSACIGTAIGLLAGYYGGLIESALMRFTDGMLAIPVLPLMIVFSALDLGVLFGGADAGRAALLSGALGLVVVVLRVLGADARSGDVLRASLVDGVIVAGAVFGLHAVVFRAVDWSVLGEGNLASVVKIILIIVFFGWMTVARLARAAALQIKELEFVTAARALGASDRRIVLVHVLPNAMAPIIVAATLEVGGNILYEAALSYLGLGIQPPVPSWGNMLNNALEYIRRDAMLAFWPGLFILVTVACFNFFGDGMRDALDPHQVMKGKTP